MKPTFERSCKDKYQYRNKYLAVEGLRSLNIENRTRLKYKIGNKKNHGKLNVYFCRYCGYWHIGHITGKDGE